MQVSRADARSIGLRYPALDRLAFALLVAGFCVLLCFSPHALIRLGYPYEAPLLGPIPFKVHPGTYLILLALFCALSSRGNPMRTAFALARREPLLAVYLALVMVTLAWVIALHGTSGAAFIVDTYWMTAFLALTLALFDDDRRRLFLKVLAGALLANALIALVESALKERLTPLYVQSQVSAFASEAIFRPSALLGHPLMNAKVTATFLAIGVLLPWHPALRWMSTLLLILALLAFGGRFAMVTAVVVYGSWLLFSLLRHVLRGRFSYLQLTGGSLLMMLVVAGLVALVAATGLGERIFTGLVIDKSASVRLQVWSAYDYVTAEQIWLGMSARDIDQVALRLGLDPVYEAIENSWIYLSLQFGLVLFTVWLVAFVCLFARLLPEAPALARLGVLVYLLNVSTTNTLAAKTISLGLVAAFLMASAAQARHARHLQVDSAQGTARAGRNTGWRVLPSWAATPGPQAPMSGAGLNRAWR